MLLGLSLKNFAIIDELSIDFGEGLNVITGETGAGKSVIVDAVSLILGDRASADLIKSDKQEANISALFDLKKNTVLSERLYSLGFETEGDELLIRRVISRTGRGRVFVNDNLAAFSMLDQITNGLIDVFSQHEHQSLLREESHIHLLDEFGALRESVQKFAELYNRYVAAKRELERLEKSRKDRVEREDFLKFQLGEIDSANLKPNEDERLEEERKKLANAESLHFIANAAYRVLYEDERSILDMLRGARGQIEEGARIDSELAVAGKAIERSIVEAEEAAYTLRDYSGSIRFDPHRLSEIETRLQEIKKLKKKHGGTIADILEKRAVVERELAEMYDCEDTLKSLIKEAGDLEASVDSEVEKLSEKRQLVSKGLVSAVTSELGHVGIKGGRFTVELSKKEVSSGGCDRVAFLFSANPDEKPKPLTKIASGGELSRIMLILKEVLSRVEGGSVLIFDEADSGIGGAVAEVVGKKIKDLSKKHQVICITHLPQVAKFADKHFRVTKTFRDNKTEVRVEALYGEERVKELARMLSGIKVTEKTIEAAREMLRD